MPTLAQRRGLVVRGARREHADLRGLPSGLVVQYNRDIEVFRAAQSRGEDEEEATQHDQMMDRDDRAAPTTVTDA